MLALVPIRTHQFYPHTLFILTLVFTLTHIAHFLLHHSHSHTFFAFAHIVHCLTPCSSLHILFTFTHLSSHRIRTHSKHTSHPCTFHLAHTCSYHNTQKQKKQVDCTNLLSNTHMLPCIRVTVRIENFESHW